MQNEIEKLFDEGVNLYEQGRMDEAEIKLLEALKHDASSDEIKYNLALVYLEKKEYNNTNLLISQIKEIDCDEIVDELEKVDFDFQNETRAENLIQSNNDSIEKESLFMQNIISFSSKGLHLSCNIIIISITDYPHQLIIYVTLE